MNFIKRYILVSLFILVSLTGVANAAVQVYAQIEKSKDIYVGENFGYYIILKGADKEGQVDLAPLQKYKPQSSGSRKQSSTNIINNKVTQSITTIMSYSLICNQAGQIEIPSVTVMHEGKHYQTNPVKVNILKPGTTDQLDIQLELSERKCYVGQPVLMTIKFYFFAEISYPQFNVPVFKSDSFYCENPDFLSHQAKEFDLGTGTTAMISQYEVMHKGKKCNLLVLQKILIPKISGKIRIDPVEVSTDVAVGRSRSRDRFFGDFLGSSNQYKRFMVKSEAMELNVLPLPEEGKPDDFYGLVGNFTISANATPVKVNVGDPITLTIKIGGSEFLKPVRWPTLEDIKEMSENFKIPSEKASPVIENGFKVFTQTIRANNDKVQEIPSIPLAYLDSDNDRYEVVKTKPIKLDVSPTKILTSADLQGLDFTPVNREVEAIKKGLSANYEGLDALTNQNFSPLVAAVSIPYLLIWSGPLILLIVSSALKFFTHTTEEKIIAKRRRTASSKAIGQLKQLDSYSDEKWYELFASTMKQYIGDRFDKIAGSLTSDDCYEIIMSQTNDIQSAEKYKEVVSSCEAARYASTEQTCENVKIEETIELIKLIEKKTRK